MDEAKIRGQINNAWAVKSPTELEWSIRQIFPKDMQADARALMMLTINMTLESLARQAETIVTRMD